MTDSPVSTCFSDAQLGLLGTAWTADQWAAVRTADAKLEKAKLDLARAHGVIGGLMKVLGEGEPLLEALGWDHGDDSRPPDRAASGDVDARDKELAREALGDLSGASIIQLSLVYEACRHADDVWLSAGNKPAASDGENIDYVDDISARECSRLNWMCDLIVAELRRRPFSNDRDERERARVLADRFHVVGQGDAALHADLLRSMGHIFRDVIDILDRPIEED